MASGGADARVTTRIAYAHQRKGGCSVAPPKPRSRLTARVNPTILGEMLGIGCVGDGGWI
jgi:hypothetical protein